MTSEFDAELFSSPEEQSAYEEFCAHQEQAERFCLDQPVLVCRWRMAHRKVPLLNRHIRALGQRCSHTEVLSRNLVSWAKQHIEWSLEAGAFSDPNGVLMLVVDINGNAAMSVGPYEPLALCAADALRERAERAQKEAEQTGVAPEVLCYISEGALVVGLKQDDTPCAMLSLVEQLCSALGISCTRVGWASKSQGVTVLVSDEHGVVLAQDESGCNTQDAELAHTLAADVAKLYA